MHLARTLFGAMDRTRCERGAAELLVRGNFNRWVILKILTLLDVNLIQYVYGCYGEVECEFGTT